MSEVLIVVTPQVPAITIAIITPATPILVLDEDDD